MFNRITELNQSYYNAVCRLQTTLCLLENFNCFSWQDTDKFIHDLSDNNLQEVSNFTSIMQFFPAWENNYVFSLIKAYVMPRWKLNGSQKTFLGTGFWLNYKQ